MFHEIKHPRTIFVLGGLVASIILVGFGVASIVIGIQGRSEVQDTLGRENIVGPQDSTIPGQLVDTGGEARAMADIMREHTLTSTQGLTYAEMGKYKTADGNPKGTNDTNLAVKDASGKPLSNTARDLWVTETALTTSLNTAYFAEQVGTFAIVMGVALLLSGIGFSVLSVGALWKHEPKEAEEKVAAAGGVAIPTGAK